MMDFNFLVRYSLLLFMALCQCLSVAFAADTLKKSRTDSDLSCLDSLIHQTAIWGNLTERGKYDSVLIAALPYLKVQESRKYLSGIAYAGYYVAQAYHFKGQPDSTGFYINKLHSYLPKMKADTTWQIMFYNLSALHAIKAKLDYPEGIKQLNNALNLVRLRHAPVNETILMCNIVSVYYLRKDTTGLDLAQMAYKVSRTTNSAYARCFASICMGFMYVLRGEETYSLKYLNEAQELSYKHGLDYLKSSIYLLYGDLYKKKGSEATARDYYKLGLKYMGFASPEVGIELCASYGDLLKNMRCYAEAEELYRRGLNASQKHHDREQRHNLLLGMAEVYKYMEEKDSALKYYTLYNEARDSSILGTKTERRLGALERIWKNKDNKEPVETLESEVDNGTGIYWWAFGGIVLLMGGTFYYTYKHSRRVKMEPDLLMDTKQDGAIEDNCNSESDSEKCYALYLKLQQLMETEEFYRRNDLSLEKIAEMLHTNRSYVSKVINTCAGTNFHGYINLLRINKAVELLSDVSYQEPLKVLAGDLGYNTLAVFYRAFQKQTGMSPSKFRNEKRGGAYVEKMDTQEQTSLSD